MRKCFPLVVLIVSVALGRAQSTPHWFRIRSEHFTILTDSSEKQGWQIAGQFERMRELIPTLLPNAASDAAAPIVVLALKDRRGLQALEPVAYLAKGQLDLAGLFLRAADKNYILIRLDAKNEQHPFATVYHEYIHFAMRKAEWLPLWLNEGLAEFYQNTDIGEKEVRLGQPSPDDILYLRRNRLLPLITLLLVDQSSPFYHEEQKASVFYAESWALTHYLEMYDKDKGTHRLQDYAKYLLQKEEPLSAAQHAFGDLHDLEIALDTYIRQGDFKQTTIKASFEKYSFRADTISADEANVIRADVLASDGRAADSRALLETVLRHNPGNAPAHETMGYLLDQQHDIAGAKKWFGEAVKLNSQSYLANYYYAVMSMKDNDQGIDASIEASLRSAIRLEPAFAPAYDALAGFYRMRNKNLDEAYRLSEQAIELEPEVMQYRLDSAQIEVQRQQIGNGIRILQAALEAAKQPADIALLRSRLDQLRQFQAVVMTAQSTGATVTITVAPDGSLSSTTRPRSKTPALNPPANTPAPALPK